jgi:hypothetical protein
MSQRIFKKGFSNSFTGIDGQMSAIEPDADAVNRAVNLEMAVGNSLRGRVGCQTSGRHSFFAIFPYRYTRTQDQYDIVYQTAAGTYPNQTTSLATTKTAADGASIEKLIALNRQAWMLDTMNIVITQTNAGAYTWYTYVSGSNINFRINKDAVSILDTSIGDGVASSLTTIYSLLGTIDALADLAISRTTRGTCPPFAIVNGNQTSTLVTTTAQGNVYQFTVNAGHNFSAGDIISWTSSVVLGGGPVLSTTATTINYLGGAATVLNNDVLGYMGQFASNFPISTVSSESGGVMTLSFPYWRLIPEGDRLFGFPFTSAFNLWQNKASGSFYAPPTAVNDSGNLYIAASGQASAGSTTYSNNLMKLDGIQVSRAGLPVPIQTATVFGGGALTGTFKYKCFIRRYDNQGNIIDGPVSNVVSVTYAANKGLISGTQDAYSGTTGFHVRGAFKHTLESPAAGVSFYVDDSFVGVGNNAFIQPGDIICLTNNTSQTAGTWFDKAGGIVLGELQRTRCTAYTPQTATISPTISSIKVENSSGYTINADTPISTGTTIVFLRTTVGGNQYYVLCEVPYNGYTFTSFEDEALDTVLVQKEQYTEIALGKEHNPPPPCSLVAQHQGGLVVARGILTPNTVAFSTAEGIEYFPTASNSFDVPSTRSGFITAIASDTDDRLAVFKEKAYYDIVGDLDNGAFSVNVRNEGDYGITSQASLVRVAGGLVGLSKNGFVTIKDGFMDTYKFQESNARFINQPYQYAWATAVNDYFCRNYICTVPQISGEPVSYVIDYSRGDIKVMERSYATQIDQAGGMAMIGDTLYHLSQTSPYSVFRRLIRFDSANVSPTGNNGDSFIDNTGAINYVLETNAINFGEPGQRKVTIRMGIWSVPNDYVQEGWVPFSLLIETASSPMASYIGGSNPNSSTISTTFATVNDVYKEVKVKNCKTFFYLIRFTTNTIRTSPFISGYEIMFSAAYDKEDLTK